MPFGKKIFLVLAAVFLTGVFISKFSAKVSSQSSTVVLGPWQETAAFVDSAHRSHPLPSFAIGDYYYVHTKGACDTCSNDRIVYYARQQTDGSLSSWQAASTDHGGGPHGYTAVALNNTAFHFRNGHIAQYIFNPSDGRISEIRLLENQEANDAFAGNKYMWDTAVYVPFITAYSYIYHLGGFNMAAHSYDVNDMFYTAFPPSSNTPFPQQNATFNRARDFEMPINNPNKAAFYPSHAFNGGFIYMGARGSSRLYRLRVQEDIGYAFARNWVDVGNLPSGTGNNLGDLFVIGGQLFTIRGRKVFQAAIDPTDGSLGTWDDVPPDLPVEQIDVNWNSDNTEGASYGIIGDYVYVTGPKKVYYAKIGGGQAAPSPTGHPCLLLAKQGDYDCSGTVNDADFTAWKNDFLANKTTLAFFEYWRRAAL